ncbi:MAG: EAL domain-containing protein [Terriglobales bacterium]|jgi:diguanylate cyclase (GGDEF)-like protein/PAS domain S-box-containing protein
MGKNPDKIVLLIENDLEQARLIRAMFGDQGSHSFALTHVVRLADAETYLAGHPVDIVLLDLGLSDPEGLEAARRARAAAPRASIVLLSSLGDEPKAIQAIHEGAQDYLIKGQIEPHKLMRALGNAVERKMNEEILTNEKDRAQATLDCIADALICTDMSGNITFLNPIASSMTGWPLAEAVGRPLTEAFRIVDPATRKPILDPMAKAASEDLTGKLPLDCVLIHRDGHEVFIEDSVAPIHDRDGKVTGAVIVFRDVSAARAQSEQMNHLAEHDSLTGLPNRLLFNDRLGQAISLARRHGGQAAVLYLDLDGFKKVNDSLGHAAGDKLLQAVAKRLLSCVRAPDTVSRHGGDEFAVLLQDVHRPEDAAATARRVLRALSEVHSVDGHQLHVTASIGMSLYPGDGLDAETLIRNADTAMYQAKKNGCQGCQFYSQELKVCTFEHQFTMEDLRRALEQNELTLHYQPKFDLRTGTITGAEALSRWIHPTRGTVPPGQFIPIAEESGLMLPIGDWVFAEACTQARAWAHAGRPAKTIDVNVSGAQFQSGDFLDGLFAVLSKTGLDPALLELDVTERVLMNHPERTAFVLKALRNRGVQVSVDNFGTGNSSLSSMQKLPLNALKIDRSFVRQITTVPGGTAAVEAFIDMARSLHLRVIAQGVETAADLEFLWEHDCDEAQGNFFSRPVPPDRLAKLFQSN